MYKANCDSGTTGGAKRRRRRTRGASSAGGPLYGSVRKGDIPSRLWSFVVLPPRNFFVIILKFGKFWVNQKRHNYVEASCWASHLL